MKKTGQIWVETMIYTLIGLTLIGVVLALAMPKINQQKERIIIEQSIESMNIFDSKMREVIDSGAGNIRKIEFFSIKKGKIVINSTGDEITFLIEGLSKTYSEPGAVINIGATKVVSTQLGKSSTTKIVLDYKDVANIIFENSEIFKEFGESSTPYSFSMENRGISGDKIVIDLEEDSEK